jgi:hypothetical protein
VAQFRPPCLTIMLMYHGRMSDEPIRIEESEVNDLGPQVAPWLEWVVRWVFILMQQSAKTDQMQVGSKVLYTERIFEVKKREELADGTIKFSLWGPQT